MVLLKGRLAYIFMANISSHFLPGVTEVLAVWELCSYALPLWAESERKETSGPSERSVTSRTLIRKKEKRREKEKERRERGEGQRGKSSEKQCFNQNKAEKYFPTGKYQTTCHCSHFTIFKWGTRHSNEYWLNNNYMPRMLSVVHMLLFFTNHILSLSSANKTASGTWQTNKKMVAEWILGLMKMTKNYVNIIITADTTNSY